jgi:peptide/nickel transport system ATP-binding protein
MSDVKEQPVLEVKDLSITYTTKQGFVKAAENVSFSLGCREFLGISGESGCGKTTTALSLMHLLPKEGTVENGEILFKGNNILNYTTKEVEQFRWRDISMIFQGAMNALNPVHKVIKQMTDAIMIHEDITELDARERSLELIEAVGIDSERADAYPHELSGGMKQRLMIAMALVCHPSIAIADEPTTALDVMVQAQILNLFKQLRERTNLSVILITHDLSVLAETCDNIIIMYAGQIAEAGPTRKLFTSPEHPYTMKLISSFPSVLSDKEIDFIPGNPPDLINPPKGCRFNPRCEYVIDKCREEVPPLEDENGHRVACWRRHEI